MVTEQLHEIQQRIADACTKAGRKPEAVTIVAVTKTLPPEPVNDAIDAGLVDIGENRVQEYLSKRDALHPHRFHMIGHLQRNKVRQIIESVDMIHSVDSLNLAKEIEKRAAESGKVVDVLLEVNTSGEESKHGFSPRELLENAEAMMELPHLSVRGLMTVAEYFEDPEIVRPSFQRLRELKETLASTLGRADITELSMGMTNDFEVAIEEGATIVRLGTALFGERT